MKINLCTQKHLSNNWEKQQMSGRQKILRGNTWFSHTSEWSYLQMLQNTSWVKMKIIFKNLTLLIVHLSAKTAIIPLCSPKNPLKTLQILPQIWWKTYLPLLEHGGRGKKKSPQKVLKLFWPPRWRTAQEQWPLPKMLTY